MKWFRFYHEAYRNPKVQEMRPELFKFWVNFLCVASESEERGRVASEGHLKLALGLTKPTTKRYVSELEALSLLHRDDQGGLRPHDWDDLQPDSDDAAAIKRRQRAKTYVKASPEMSMDMSMDMSLDVSTTSRARALLEGDGDREGEGKAPPPPSSPLGPEYVSVGELAIEMGGDVSWGRWVENQGRCGHDAATIRRALEECAGAGKLSQPYVASKLRGWAAEGGPPPIRSANGRQSREPPPKVPVKPKRPDLPRNAETEAIHAMWDRAEREDAERAAKLARQGVAG